MKETEREATLERINRARIERLMNQYGAKGTLEIMTGQDPEAAIRFGNATHAVLQKMVRNGVPIDVECMRRLGVAINKSVPPDALMVRLEDVTDVTKFECEFKTPDGKVWEFTVGDEEVTEEEYNDRLFEAVADNVGSRILEKYGEKRGEEIMLATTNGDDAFLRIQVIVDELRIAMKEGATVTADVCERLGIPLDKIPSDAVLVKIGLGENGIEIGFAVPDDDNKMNGIFGDVRGGDA